MLAARFIMGGWDNVLFAPLGLFIVGALAALVVDFKFYLEFFTLKTTKHGLNMGTAILLGLAIIVSVNVLAVKREKVWDFSEEKLFSLSDQSKEVIKGLSEDLMLLVFYRGAKDQPIKEQIVGTATLYKKESTKINLQVIDAFVDREKSQDYLQGLGDITDVVFFVEYKGKRVRVESPFDEEKTTSAIIKATRERQKKIYFVTGHGERDLDSEEPEGLKEFKNALIGAAYTVEKLNLMESQKVPEDAVVLAVVGTTTQLLDSEIQMIKDFAKSGGSVFLAFDPGLKHQGQLLTKYFGVEFLNNYLINDRIQIVGRGVAAGLGVIFDQMHSITKNFRSQNFTLFDVASELKPASSLPDGINVIELVKTPPSSFSVQDLKQANKPGDRRMFTVAMAAQGKLDASQQGAKDFKAVVCGDSDFVAQKDILQGLNLDLAMNAISFLADETDLISIRAKQPVGTKLELTSVRQNSFVIASIALPLLLSIIGGAIWHRRRSA